MPNADVSIPHLAQQISENVGMTTARVETVLRGLVDVMTYHLRERGESIYLHGLGRFSMHTREPRSYFDVTKGKLKPVGRRRHAVFKASQGLRGLDPLNVPRAEHSPIDECPIL